MATRGCDASEPAPALLGAAASSTGSAEAGTPVRLPHHRRAAPAGSILTQAGPENLGTGGRVMKHIGRRSFLGAIPGAMLLVAQEPGRDSLPNRPKVPGSLSLRARRRTKE